MCHAELWICGNYLSERKEKEGEGGTRTGGESGFGAGERGSEREKWREERLHDTTPEHRGKRHKVR
eukprot:scaffold29623_cov22-Tisochrysis_lutea.AAC.1